MITVQELWELGQFFMLVVPSIQVVVGMWLVGATSKDGWLQRGDVSY